MLIIVPSQCDNQETNSPILKITQSGLVILDVGSQKIILSASSKDSRVCLHVPFPEWGLERERLQGKIRQGGSLDGCSFLSDFLVMPCA